MSKLDYTDLIESLLDKAGMYGTTSVKVNENCSDEEKEVQFSTFNSKGEDVQESFWIKNDEDDLIDALGQEVYDLAENYDEDEYVESWLSAKRNGVAGVPHAEELVVAGKENQQWLYDIADALWEVKK